jgi:glycerol uptake facilitator protein
VDRRGGGARRQAVNPARDLGTRLFTLAAGYRNTGFESHAFWVPIVGPLLGGPAGALAYERGIRPLLPDRPREEEGGGGKAGDMPHRAEG